MKVHFAMLLASISFVSVAANTGAPISEPALAGRTDILHFEDWERAGWENDWMCENWEYPCALHTNVSLSTMQKVGGSKSLKIKQADGTHNGTSNIRIYLGNNNDPAYGDLNGLEEAYLRYYIWIDPDARVDNPSCPDCLDGKLPGFARRGPGTTRVGCMGLDFDNSGELCWSARGYFGSSRETPVVDWTYRNYVYALVGGVMKTVWIGYYTPNGDKELPRGEWVCVETRIKMNTPNVANGIIEGWINEVPAEYEDNLLWRTIKANNIAEVWFGTYTGGSAVNGSDWGIYFDNFVVARNRIGCLNGTREGEPIASPQSLRAR